MAGNNVKKRKVPRFRRPNLGAKGRSRVKDTWRTQRGNDNKMRAKKKNVGVMPMIGYKNNDSVRFTRKDGTLEFVIHNETELIGIAGKAGITAKFAHDLSRRKRAALQTVADSKGIRIANGSRA